MKPSIEEPDWEERLQLGIGCSPAPDFARWREQHLPTSEVRLLEQKHSDNPLPNRQRFLMPLLKIAASVLLIGGWTTWIFDGGDLSPGAFAEEIPGVDNPRALSWTTVYFVRMTSVDQKRTWIRRERSEHAYQHPGRYRSTRLDDNGNPLSVEITDMQANRTLSLNMKEKKAVLKFPTIRRDERGPFAWIGDSIRGKIPGKNSVSLKGKREIDGIEANVVRWKGTNEGKSQTADYLFDSTSKRIVGFTSGNAGSNFDPEASTEELNNPPEGKWHRMEPVGTRMHKVVLNARIASSSFSLDPPDGFEVDTIAKPTVTENELLTLLGAAAQFNDGVFPDSAIEAYDGDKFNQASRKKHTDRTEAENALIDLRDKFMMREIYRAPALQFIEDQTQPDSFQYVGAEVKLGQPDELIGWYKPKRGSTYRALYGDLSAKNVAQADLPMLLVD